MSARPRMRRLFTQTGTVTSVDVSQRIDAPRRIGRTMVDFSSLRLPNGIRHALADAFWHHFGARSVAQVRLHWGYLKLFARFAEQSAALESLADLHHDLLVRYVEWLNAQRRQNGQPWTASARAGPYTSLRKLLQWLSRCRPGLLGPLHFPFNPFPWRNRDTSRVQSLPARQLRAILKACERDISALRALRSRGEGERGNDSAPRTLGWLLQEIDRRFDGVVPSYQSLRRLGHHSVACSLRKLGGLKGVEPYLYPRAESLLPYYLSLLIHTAGNPEPIAELSCDCLQPIPLLEDRQLLVWIKRRAGDTQRRSFSNTAPSEPPVLIREILDWTKPLRARAPKGVADRLLLFKGARGISAWSAATAKSVRRDFCSKHNLPHFSLASIRPGVLSASYRACGDLLQVKALANHRDLATTVHYVRGPQIQAQHHLRIAALQGSFLGQIQKPLAESAGTDEAAAPPARPNSVLAEAAVSMFGFDCKDPLAGIAPGTDRGELCTNFLGCFTCPNAIITSDPRSLARLLRARDHLRQSAAQIHPARFEALYAPLLRILEEDVLTRFAASELAAAAPLRASLPPLPPLR